MNPFHFKFYLAWLLLHIKATQKLADLAIPTILELKVNLMPLKVNVFSIIQCHLNTNVWTSRTSFLKIGKRPYPFILGNPSVFYSQIWKRKTNFQWRYTNGNVDFTNLICKIHFWGTINMSKYRHVQPNIMYISLYFENKVFTSKLWINALYFWDLGKK